MKLTMVVVLYKQNIVESKTFQTLKSTLFERVKDKPDIEVIFYDNSPEKQELPSLEIEGIHTSYIHDSRNLGITTAYNFAWSQARENGSQWLLLLDHDTELTDIYMDEVLSLPELSVDVTAVVPKIISEQRRISPVFSNSLRPLAGEHPKEGLQEKPVMAINSGSLISVDFLNELSGFNEAFPLDYLDHWLFHEIYSHGKKVWVLHATIEHELSVMDYSRVSEQRYQSIMNSEIFFYKNYKQDLFSAYRIQLAKRFLKQLLTVKNKKIAMYTLKRLFSL
jgi:GT2 family glycosyltransferase